MTTLTQGAVTERNGRPDYTEGWTPEEAEAFKAAMAPPPPPGGRLAAQRVKLAEKLRAGPPPVHYLTTPTLGERLFYDGNVFLFSGHKKAGKSWTMAILAADQLAAGRPVVYIDQENGWEVFVERLLMLGVDPERVDADDGLIYVPFPDPLPPLYELRSEVESIAAQWPGALIVLDSLRTFLARYGLSPNKDVEIEAFFGPIMGAVKNLPAERRVTVGVIDHSNRGTKERDEYGHGGSHAKSEAVDVVYYFDRKEPFSERLEGHVKLVVKDDRRGKLDYARHYRIGGQGEGQRIRFEPVSADDVGEMRALREAMVEFLREHERDWFTLTNLREQKSIKGTAALYPRALELVAATEAHVHKRPHPKRKGSYQYCYDSSRETKPDAF
jgi:hypothetical protein